MFLRAVSTWTLALFTQSHLSSRTAYEYRNHEAIGVRADHFLAEQYEVDVELRDKQRANSKTFYDQN